MDRDPHLVNGPLQCVLRCVWDRPGSVPSCATVQHVENDVLLVNEEQTALHMFVEPVTVLCARHMAWPGLGPCSTELTHLNCFWNEVQNSLGNSNMSKEPCHHHDRGMTPA